jgi:transcription antitermination factor NusB
MTLKISDLYPLSSEKVVRGNRRLAREKVLQILLAYEYCELDIEDIFFHIFYRDFNFGDEESNPEKLLRPDEVKELEADVPIKWKDEEVVFSKSLVLNVLKIRDEVASLIEEFAKNWEMERIAPMDRILIEMGIAEFKFFPIIPPKVSINEVIDISKKYSTDKSNQFINGILDSVLDKLKKEGTLIKEGRGLINE